MASYSAADLQRLRSNGHAMAPKDSDSLPRFPIDNPSDLSNAIQAVGRADASDRPAVRRYIIGRAKALGLSSRIPENWNADGTTSDGN